jgi:hypothetical protein
VLVGESFAGYVVEGGKVLEDHSGHREPIAPDEPSASRIQWISSRRKRGAIGSASASLASGCSRSSRCSGSCTRPTRDELSSKESSRRYAGHQVQPTQALALLGSRGWVSLPEEGVRRTFHHAKVTAWLTFTEGFFSPAEIDGLDDRGGPLPRRQARSTYSDRAGPVSHLQ